MSGSGWSTNGARSASRSPESLAQRPLGGGRARRRLQRRAAGQLPQRRQPADRRAALSVELGQQAELRQLRRPEGTGTLRKSLARDRSGKTKTGDVSIRQARHGYRGAQARAALVVPDRPLPVLRERLEDQPGPLSEPGSREHLAR